MFISFRVKFDKGFLYEMDIENMRFFCCQVYDINIHMCPPDTSIVGFDWGLGEHMI